MLYSQNQPGLIEVRRKRKSALQEVLSRALYVDQPESYTVVYRDMNEKKEVSLQSFLKLSEDFTKIPAWRILEVKKSGVRVFRARPERY